MTTFRVSLATLALMSLLTHVYAQAADGEARLVVDPSWPQKPSQFTWGALSGIAVDAQDQVYVFQRGEPTVQIYRADGTLVRAWTTGNPKGTHGVRIDPQGNVWLTDFLAHVVQKYTPEGKLLLTLGEAGKRACDANHFGGPTDMAFLPNGDVFISDGYGNRRVAHFDPQGRFIKQWGEEGTAPGQFALPHSIAIDSQGRVYVADRNNARLQVFTTDGKLLAVRDEPITPWGLAITAADELWVCGASRVRQPDGSGWIIAPPAGQWLMKFDLDGKLLLRARLDTITAAPGKPGEVDWVHAVAVDSRGNVYLGDIQGKRAQKFTLRQP